MAEVHQFGRAKPAAKFTVGDMVALNSGGAWMTVRSCVGDMVEVDWHCDGGEPYTAQYPAASLTSEVAEGEKLPTCNSVSS